MSLEYRSEWPICLGTCLFAMPRRRDVGNPIGSLGTIGTTNSRAPAPYPVLAVAVLCLFFSQFVLAGEAKNVLVLYSNNRLVPGNVEVDRGLRALIAGPGAQPVQIFSEFL